MCGRCIPVKFYVRDYYQKPTRTLCEFAHVAQRVRRRKKKKIQIVCVLEGENFNKGAGHAAFQIVVRPYSTLCCVQGLQLEYRGITFTSIKRD